MHRQLIFDVEKCTGCHYCEIACSFRHKALCGRSDSLIRMVVDDKALLRNALFCHHCKKPLCAEVCPVDAIATDTKTGLVVIDSVKCIGCGVCSTACPFGGILIDAESGIARNCDLCQGKPACVEFCPTGALECRLPGEERRSKELAALL